jgi:hypothetical protein
MSTRITILTVFALGVLVGVLLALMWIERNTPTDTDGARADWRSYKPMATRRSAS